MATRTLLAVLLLALSLSAQVVDGRGHKIMIFGGKAHDVYLGCLSCSEYASDSVLNKYGKHGSEYSGQSIWNDYGNYGSPYSDLSACNEYANNAPVIVDEEGSYYGRLTLNEYHRQIGSGTNFLNWLKNVVCK